MPETDVIIRPATPDDPGLILELIGELAAYEGLTQQVMATEAALAEALFGPTVAAEAMIAELGGTPAGFALFFQNFSTFVGRPGLYLEDLYVRPAYRERGIGRALLRHLAGLAVERGCRRMEWVVLNWNAPAMRVYDAIGATALKDWTLYRLDGTALIDLAGRPPDQRTANPESSDS